MSHQNIKDHHEDTKFYLVPTRCLGMQLSRPYKHGTQCVHYGVPTQRVTAIKLRILVRASSQAPAWEFGVGSSSFPSREAGASSSRFPSRSLGTSVKDQHEDTKFYLVPTRCVGMQLRRAAPRVTRNVRKSRPYKQGAQRVGTRMGKSDKPCSSKTH